MLSRMATGYQGYAGYGTDEAKAKRIRGLADMLTQQSMQDRFAPVQHWTQGLGRMAEAMAANNLAAQADQAETAYGNTVKDRNARLASALMPDAAGVTNDQLNTAAPFDLTPKGVEGRATQAATNNGQRAILEALLNDGGLSAGLGYVQGQEQRQYDRSRDANEDRRWEATFGYQKDRDAVGDARWDTEFGYRKGRDEVGDTQWNQQFAFQQGRAEVADDQWRSEFGETRRQFDARMAAEKAAADAKAKAAASGSAVFEGPQLATIYNRSMDALEDAKSRQTDLDTIANASQQFLDVVKGDDWLQGAGWFNDLMQAGSTRTSEAKKLTDTIAPLIRRPGSGGNSDNDIIMFKNSVVNVNNTPQSNRLAAAQAKALQGRGQAYVDYLTRAINPRDPQSKQKADALWNLYKNDQPLFDPESGKVLEPQPFEEWLAENMGAANAASKTADDGESLIQKWSNR